MGETIPYKIPFCRSIVPTKQTDKNSRNKSNQGGERILQWKLQNSEQMGDHTRKKRHLSCHGLADYCLNSHIA